MNARCVASPGTLACCPLAEFKRDLPTRSADKTHDLDLRRTQRAAIYCGWKVGICETMQSIRRKTARNFIATSFAIAILTAIPSPGRAKEGAPAIKCAPANFRSTASAGRSGSIPQPCRACGAQPLGCSNQGADPGGTLPDPQISFQHFSVGGPRPVSGFENSDFYYTGFGVSQDIPWPGKLGLQSRGGEGRRVRQTSYEAAERASTKRSRRFTSSCSSREDAGHPRSKSGRTAPDREDCRNPLSARTRPAAGPDQGAAPDHRDPEGARDAHQEEDQDQLELKQLLGRDPDSRDIEVGDVELTHLISTRRSCAAGRRGSPDLGIARWKRAAPTR